MGKLAPAAIDFLTARGHSPAKAETLGVISVRRVGPDHRIVPDPERGDAIQFTYLDETGTKGVNAKYRDIAQKRLWQPKGRKPVFWNLPDLKVAAEKGQPLVITEGEFDALAAIEAGYYAVSVPNGAPPAGYSDDLQKEMAGTRWSYLWEAREHLSKVKEFVLCTDDDAPGRALRDGLIARLGAARCWVVEYPKGAKDLGDILRTAGVDDIRLAIERRIPYPIMGVYTLDDLPDRPTFEILYDLKWMVSRDYLKLYPGEFIPITGIPGEGKSTFALNILAHLYERHGVRSAIFSPEMPVKPYLERKLLRLYAGDAIPPGMMPIQANAFLEDQHAIRGAAKAKVADAHVFLDRDPTDESVLSLEWIIEKATEAVLRYDIRALLIDPWNEVDHARKSNENTTEYVNRAIRTLKNWAQAYGIIVMVVAHPTKAIQDHSSGKDRRPTLYDIEGSAAWRNKADCGLIVHRPRDEYGVIKRGYAEVIVEKSRFEEIGEVGTFMLEFEQGSGRYLDAKREEP